MIDDFMDVLLHLPLIFVCGKNIKPKWDESYAEIK